MCRCIALGEQEPQPTLRHLGATQSSFELNTTTVTFATTYVTAERDAYPRPLKGPPDAKRLRVETTHASTGYQGQRSSECLCIMSPDADRPAVHTAIWRTYDATSTSL